MSTSTHTVRAVLAALLVAVATLSGAGAAQAHHVAEIGPATGHLEGGGCYVGAEAFTIAGAGPDGANAYFGVGLRTAQVSRDVVQGQRTLAYTCRFTGVPTSLRAFDPEGPLDQPGRNPWLAADYKVPLGGFSAVALCWDRFEPGLVQGLGTIRVSHRGTAELRCDLREAYARYDADV